MKNSITVEESNVNLNKPADKCVWVGWSEVEKCGNHVVEAPMVSQGDRRPARYKLSGLHHPLLYAISF